MFSIKNFYKLEELVELPISERNYLCNLSDTLKDKQDSNS